jgi:hypothetical protein
MSDFAKTKDVDGRDPAFGRPGHDDAELPDHLDCNSLHSPDSPAHSRGRTETFRA